METFHDLISIACLMIVFTTVWACLGETIRDGLVVKISLGMTSLAAYLAFVHSNERTLGLLIIAIGITSAAICFQRFILRSRLIHHIEGDKSWPNNYPSTLILPNSQKVRQPRATISKTRQTKK